MTTQNFKKNGRSQAGVSVPQIAMRDLLNTVFYYRRVASAIVLAFFGLSILIVLVMPPVYRAEARLLTLYAGYYDMQLDRSVGRAAPAFDPTQVVNVEAQILSSPELHRAIVRSEAGDQADTETLDQALQSFERRFRLEKVDAANLIDVSYADSDPNHAAHVLDELIAQYFRQRSGVFTQGRLAFLIDQRDKVREQLDSANAQLIAFQRAHGVVNIDAQISSAVALQGLLQQRKLENETALSQDQSTLDALIKEARNVPSSIELFRDNTEAAHALDTMHLSLLQLKSRRADLASRYMLESPFVEQMDQQIVDVDNSIGEQQSRLISAVRTGHNSYYDTVQDRIVRLNSDVAGEAARKSSLERQNTEADETIRRLIATANQLRRMEIDRDLLIESFKTFSRQVEESRIEQNQMDTSSSTNVRIIQAPFPPTHRSNPPILFLAAGLVAGILVAGLSVIVLSSLRETFLSPEEIERSLGLPVLRAPLNSDPPPSVTMKLQQGRLAPLFRLFQGGAKTSNRPGSAPFKGEFGRMIVAINNSSETLSKLVLLLTSRDDDDLEAIIEGLVEELERRATRSVLLLDLATSGMSLAATGADGRLHWPGGGLAGPAAQSPPISAVANTVFAFTPVEGRRIVVGRVRPDVVMPIGRQASELFDALRQSHDYVVIHTPPAGGSFIGVETSVLADATIMAIRAEVTRKPVALTLKSQVQDAGGLIVGIVMTNRHSYIPNFVYRFL
ncbi:hypothetical protein [Telmatospirillum sp.]|uniref:GumC family protein n=1 Tax=Telmatospirillum sp. TaxID=2079197 RepID=UPI00284416FF|nr:hypothetical protein [Telmatospirillum sp.]MDR3439116.1 hypothetical protein [Telmatospirillum sp.]